MTVKTKEDLRPVESFALQWFITETMRPLVHADGSEDKNVQSLGEGLERLLLQFGDMERLAKHYSRHPDGLETARILEEMGADKSLNEMERARQETPVAEGPGRFINSERGRGRT